MDTKKVKQLLAGDSSIIQNRNALYLALSNLFPGEKGDIAALMVGFDAGFVAFAFSNKEGVKANDAARYMQIMEEKYALANHKAEWVVKTWAEILNVEIQEKENSPTLQKKYLSRDKVFCIMCHTKCDPDAERCVSCNSPLYGHAFDDDSEIGPFTRYIKNMTDRELIAGIEKTYNILRGTCLDHPRLGYNGGVVFAELLLLIQYIKESGGNNEVQMGLLFFVGMAFAQMTGGPFDNGMDDIISNSNIIELQDWHDGYILLETFLFDRINSFNFCEDQKSNAKMIYATMMRPVGNTLKSDYECLQYFDSWGLNLIDFFIRY